MSVFCLLLVAIEHRSEVLSELSIVALKYFFSKWLMQRFLLYIASQDCFPQHITFCTSAFSSVCHFIVQSLILNFLATLWITTHHHVHSVPKLFLTMFKSTGLIIAFYGLRRSIHSKTSQFISVF